MRSEVIAGLAAGLLAVPTLVAQEPEPAGLREEYVSTADLNTVLEDDLKAIEGMESRVLEVEFPAGWVGERHYHTGDVFVYVLEGELVVDVDGEGRLTFGPGEVYHEALNTVMQARNPRPDAGTRAILFQVGKEGEPLMIRANGAGPPVSAPDEVVALRQVIEGKNAIAERWYRVGQIDSLATMFAEDVWQMPPNSPPLVGREALRGFWSQAVRWGEWTFDLQVQDVVASGPIAVERGRYTLSFAAGREAPPEMASFEDRGHYVALWRRDPDGEWRIVWDAPVSELPPAGGP